MRHWRTILITGGAVVVVAALLLMVVVAVSGHTGKLPDLDVRDGASTPRATPLPPLPRMPLTSDTRYVALGDSYAAGMGAGDDVGRCRRSPAYSYPAVFARDTGVNLVGNVACAGATTADVTEHQLDALGPKTNLVTLSIGGNDLRVADIAATCTVKADAKCQRYFTDALKTMKVLPLRLENIYASIAAAAPNARIVVTGYTPFFVPPKPSSKEFDTVTAVNSAVYGLNQVIHTEVDSLRATGVAISYVPVDFGGHRIGSATPWLNTQGPDQYHPNAAGYREYARAVEADLKH